MSPETPFLKPGPDLETGEFNFRSELNELAAEAVNSFETVLAEGGTKEIVLGFKKPPYFTYNLDFMRGFAYTVGIYYLNRETEEIMGGEVVLRYGKAEKREDFIEDRDEGKIERITIKVTVDPEEPEIDSEGRPVLDVEIVSWQLKMVGVRHPRPRRGL